MKKTLIALAALASVGAASAQSSVTLYGRVDANYTYQMPGDRANVASGPLGDAVSKLNDGGVNGVGGSRWGLRGTEDLGGGLQALFLLESGFNVDDGSQGASGVLFNRQAWVGLGSTSLGQIRAGRVETLTRELDVGFADVSAESELNLVENIAVQSGAPGGSVRPLFQNLGTRVNNAVTYRSPSWGGFQISGLVAAGEGVTARQQGLSATYRGGPFAIGLAYEQYDGFGTTYNDVVTVGGNWNFGFATIYGAYQMTSDFGTASAAPIKFAGSGIDHDAYSVGLVIPFGNFSFRGQWTQSEVDYPSGIGAPGDVKQDKWGLSLRYALSKRTGLYAVYTQRGGDYDDYFKRQSEFVVGVGHNF